MTYQITISKDPHQNCSICLDPFHNQLVAIHERGGEHHPLHINCLTAYVQNQLQQQRHLRCPVCRLSIRQITKINIEKTSLYPNISQISEEIFNIFNPILVPFKSPNAAVELDMDVEEEILKIGSMNLEKAAQDGNWQNIQSLIILFPSFRAEHLSNAAHISFNQGYDLIAKYIIQQIPNCYPSILRFIKSFKEKNLTFIEFFLSHIHLSTEDRFELLFYAIKKGKENLCIALLPPRSHLFFNSNAAFLKAISADMPRLIRNIIQRFSVDKFILHAESMSALKKDQLEHLKAMLPAIKKDQTMLNNLFSESIKINKIESVQIISNYGISKKIIEKECKNALKMQHNEIYLLLKNLLHTEIT